MFDTEPPAEEQIDLQDHIRPIGKSILQFLWDTRNGATVQDILQNLRAKFRDQDGEQLNHNVKTILEKGVAYGFLDQVDSHAANAMQEQCGTGRRPRCSKSCCGVKKRVPRGRRSRRRSY